MSACHRKPKKTARKFPPLFQKRQGNNKAGKSRSDKKWDSFLIFEPENDQDGVSAPVRLEQDEPFRE
jgi:hypothetical protein